MTVSKSDFLKSLKDEQPYCYICGPNKGDKGTDIGFIVSRKLLESAMAAFAQSNGYSRVKLYWGRNIMNVDEGPITFDIAISIK